MGAGGGLQRHNYWGDSVSERSGGQLCYNNNRALLGKQNPYVRYRVRGLLNEHDLHSCGGNRKRGSKERLEDQGKHWYGDTSWREPERPGSSSGKGQGGW